MGTEYKFEGETFLLDDTKGCYVEATYGGQIGYVGVNPHGTAETPYFWWPDETNWVTPDGLTNGNPGTDMQSSLNALCAQLLRQYREAEARKTFKPEDACGSLHEFVQSVA